MAKSFQFFRSEHDKHCFERLQIIKEFHSKLKATESPNAYLGYSLLDELADNLECPVCNTVSTTFSFLQCKNGHLVCEGCFSKLSVCPVCRISFTRKIRPLSEEKAADVRHMYGTIERDGIILNRDLVEFFRCQTCLFVPTRTPIWVCNNSHIICQCCMEIRFPLCLQCRDCVKQPLFRNLLAEKLLCNIPKPCRFANHGCAALIVRLDEHERIECPFREASCIVPTCSEKVPLTSYWDHLQEPGHKHEPILPSLDKRSQRGKGSLLLPANFVNLDYLRSPYEMRIRMNYLQLNNRDKFFMVCHASLYYESFFFWVYYVGYPRNAMKFIFKLRLFKEGHTGQINVSGPVVSVEETHQNLIRSPHAFEISSRDVREFWNQSTLSVTWDVSVEEKRASEVHNRTFVTSTRS